MSDPRRPQNGAQPTPAKAFAEMSEGRIWQPRVRKPELIKVTDRIYCSHDYAISNVIYVITDKSVIVIDTTESLKAARAAFGEFRKICRLPVSHMIYTHFHDDHVRGASVFHQPHTTVIAQRRMPEERDKLTRMLPYRTRANALQFGSALSGEARGVSLAYQSEFSQEAVQPGDSGGYLPPDILFDEEYQFEEGGVALNLYHTQGETHDHLMIWIPQEGALFPADLFYPSFPMLGNPFKPDRPVLAWADSIERMRAFRPEYLVPSHSKPRRGARAIDAALVNYARAIRHVHDQTIALMNEGLPLDQIRRQVKLPEDLANLPYLRETYGKVDWAVVGVFRQNAGWYSDSPKDLKPSPRGVIARAVLDACGGVQPLLRRARRAWREGVPQLVLELTDLVLSVRPRHTDANELKNEALRRLGMQARNGVERNIYLAAIEETTEKRGPARAPERGGETHR
jgi:alkyl sulfatase BDS1-like metallo-beta-lactamase superfamily hydrolase